MKKMTMFFSLILFSFGFAQETKELVNNDASKISMLKTLKTGATQSLPFYAPTGGEVTYLVDYEGAGETKGAYASGDVVLSGLNWNMTEALIGTLPDDFKNGVRSARLRGYGTSSITMLEDKTDGLGEITFLYRRYGTDAQVDWRVEYSDDAGVTWTQIGSDFTSPANDDVQTFSEEVNVEGDVRIRILRATPDGTTNRRLNIDDIQLTDYVAGGAECLDWLNPSPTTGWGDFNTIYGGAPGAGCPFNEITEFEVWAAEAYSVNNFVAGTEYTFSMCNGPGAGSWIPDFTIIAPSGTVDAFGEGDGDGCSITWTASESGTYFIVINEEGFCGGGSNTATDNGYPALTCTGGGGSFPEPYCGPITFEFDVEPITNVEVAGIANVSDPEIGVNPAHEDFTSIEGTVEQGGSYSIALEGNTGGNWENFFTVFIDWNQNDILDDEGEIYQVGSIINSTGTDGQQATGNIDVPEDALVGSTRMRVFKVYEVPNGYVIDPCSMIQNFGQVEDYTLNVTSGGSGGCTTPVITNTTGDDICSGDTATLTAETDGEELLWFDSEVDGNLLFTGASYTTDPLTTTTSFWVEARNYGSGGGTPQTGGARVAPTNTSSATVVQATSPWGLEFTVEEDFVLNSVDVYLASANPGDLVVQLKDLDLNILEEITIACPAGNTSNPVQFEIPLDWNVEAGNTYRLVAESSPTMVREFSSGHPGFPYPIGDVGTVTNGTINNAYTNTEVYYFFYNWAFTPGTGEYCASDRVEVVANVTVTPPPVAVSPQEYIEGQTLADLDVDGENLTWYADPDGNTELPESTPLEDGVTYYVSQTIDGCESELIPIEVNVVISIEDNIIEGLQYYPNPVSNVLNITAEMTIDNAEIYNLLGQKILNQNLNSTSGQIDLSKLASGSYLMKVYSGEMSTTFQIVKR